jgi:hypothetical protein
VQSTDARRTAPGPGVTVQSMAELIEMKRQEQKKAMRQSNRDERDENEVSADILGFETDNWKAAREEALTGATQRPLFSSPYKVHNGCLIFLINDDILTAATDR